MRTPAFMATLIFSVFMDIALIFIIPFSGYAAYLILMLLVLFLPALVAVTFGDALKWMSERSQQDSIWSNLPRLMCGSGLVFLVLAATLAVLPEPSKGNLFEILARFYLVVLVIRFQGAGLLNILISIVGLIKGKSQLDRLSSFSAILCSAAAFAILKPLSEKMMFAADGDPRQYIFQLILMIVLLTVSFAYGLVWGGAMQWLASKTK